MSAVIPPEDWIWQGHAGHFSGSDNCRFRLCTVVGRFIISTVGEYRVFDTFNLSPLGAEADGLYETMVFAAGKFGECGCVLIAGEEKTCRRYANAPMAAAGHLGLCREWAMRQAENADEATHES